MSNLSLNVSVTGLESIDSDLKDELKRIEFVINNAASDIGNVMMEDLKQRINIDVYRAYTPTEYPRRSVNSQFGIPLNNMSRNTTPIFQANESEIGVTVGIIYKPDGSHSGTTADLSPTSAYYDADNPKSLKPNPVHGDDLIRRIETGRGYDWNAHPGKRPFWKNFIEDMLDNGIAERELVTNMKSQGYPLEGNTQIILEGNYNDGIY